MFLALLFSALGLAPGAAHVLEMPVKLGYTPEQYLAVTSTLYAFFGSVGAAIQIAALPLTGALAYLSRGLPAFRAAIAALIFLILSLVAWGTLVAPVNAQWGEAIKLSLPTLPSLYAELRPRWEYGHAAAFAFWLLGYCCLQWFAIGDQSGSKHSTHVA